MQTHCHFADVFAYSEFYSGRLVARTPAFQVGEAGSKPVRSTKFCKCQQEKDSLGRFFEGQPSAKVGRVRVP